jgi:hypothetical protein
MFSVFKTDLKQGISLNDFTGRFVYSSQYRLDFRNHLVRKTQQNYITFVTIRYEDNLVGKDRIFIKPKTRCDPDAVLETPVDEADLGD